MVATDFLVIVGYRLWVIYKQRAHLSQKGTPWRETERFHRNCKAKKILLMVMVQKRIMFMSGQREAKQLIATALQKE
jgi:hypothetical protein